jgi:hypothetical protein
MTLEVEQDGESQERARRDFDLSPSDVALEDGAYRLSSALFAGAKVEIRSNSLGQPIVEIEGIPMSDVREVKLLLTAHGSELHIRQRIKAGTDKAWVDSWRDFYVPNPNIFAVAKRPEEE